MFNELSSGLALCIRTAPQIALTNSFCVICNELVKFSMENSINQVRVNKTKTQFNHYRFIYVLSNAIDERDEL